MFYLETFDIKLLRFRSFDYRKYKIVQKSGPGLSDINRYKRELT
jgi:hypothetical protein